MIAPYYAADGVELYLGDCLEVLAELDAAPGGLAFDHAITDPPYEAEAHTKGRRVPTGTRPGHAVESWRTAAGTRVVGLDFAPIDEATRDAVSAYLARARRWSLVFCQVEAAMRWRAALEAAGAVYKRAAVWVKPDGQPQLTGDRPGMGYETIVAAHAPGRSRWNGGGRLGVFTHVKNVSGSREKPPHPTTKPAALMRELVALFTDTGDLILDPFAGGGSTGVAALELGRGAVLVELEERYAEAAAKRLEAVDRQPALFGAGRPRAQQSKIAFEG